MAKKQRTGKPTNPIPTDSVGRYVAYLPWLLWVMKDNLKLNIPCGTNISTD